MPNEAQAVADQSYAAAESEADSRGWGTSQEDIEAYAAAAGAAAGAAACAASGVAAAAAPLCAWVAGELAGWIAGVCGDWFTDDEEAEAARQRRIDVRAHFASMAIASELDRENARTWNQYLDNLIAMHAELWPGSRWEGLDPNHPQARWQRAMLILQLNGAPVTERFGEHTLLGLESVRDLWSDLDRQGVADAHKTTWITERAIEIFDQLERAYTASVLQLTTARGGEHALSELERNQAAKARISARVGAKYTSATAADDSDRRVFGSASFVQQATAARARPGHRVISPEHQSWLIGGSILGGALFLVALTPVLPWHPLVWLGRNVP